MSRATLQGGPFPARLGHSPTGQATTMTADNSAIRPVRLIGVKKDTTGRGGRVPQSRPQEVSKAAHSMGPWASALIQTLR